MLYYKNTLEDNEMFEKKTTFKLTLDIKSLKGLERMCAICNLDKSELLKELFTLADLYVKYRLKDPSYRVYFGNKTEMREIENFLFKDDES